MLDPRSMPELVSRQWLREQGLTVNDTKRILRACRPVLRIPGSRSVYVQNKDVLAALKGWMDSRA